MKRFSLIFFVVTLCSIGALFVLDALVSFSAPSMDIAGYVFVATIAGAIFAGWIFHVTLRKDKKMAQETLAIVLGVFIGSDAFDALYRGAPLLNVLVSSSIATLLFVSAYVVGVRARKRAQSNISRR